MRQPLAKTLLHAFRLSMREDKPIVTDYWQDSLRRTCRVGRRSYIDQTGKEVVECMLVKSKEEYTSLIGQQYRISEVVDGVTIVDLIAVTENSIYLVDGGIKAVAINAVTPSA